MVIILRSASNGVHLSKLLTCQPTTICVRGILRPGGKNKRAARQNDKRMLPVYLNGAYASAQQDPERAKTLKFGDFVPAPNYESSSVFDDPFLTRVIHHCMRKGQKAEADDMIREVMYLIKKDQLKGWRAAADEAERNKFELDPLELMKKAVANASPVAYCRPIKKGGVVYQVPVPMTDGYSEYFGLRWIRQAAFDHPDPWREIFVPALAREFQRAFRNEGKAIKNKYDLHKLAETNKAYAHYRWN
ncbi:mitochondrial ribosomal protein S7 isoform X2 [Brevipalpus obovatus]|uniref:mitochondrial ribosomal protein S7 isoform X2 n=1 Tax=Brevipalpus obovatus TaxID=246614 RepID=UPI003D9F93D0